MTALLAFIAMVAATSAPSPLADAEQAIASGRLVQARAMIATAIRNGTPGEMVDRLLADLAFAANNHGEALVRYQALLKDHPQHTQVLDRMAIAALRSGHLAQARAFADQATSLPAPSWTAWNVRGVVADLDGDFGKADTCYARALAISPDHPQVLTNLGWSRLLRGDWAGAIEMLERAVALPQAPRVAVNNLDLARSGLANDLPARRRGESEDEWAARLNDAGVAANLRGDRARAIAAFSRALEAHGTWYVRAANNLAEVSVRP